MLSCHRSQDDVRIGPEVRPTVPCCTEPAKLPTPQGQCSWQVKFSPNGGAEQQVVDTIKASDKSLYMLSYSFTSQPIADALVYIKSKGATVEVILDPSNKTGKGSKLDALLTGGVTVYIDDKHAIAHNKFAISNRTKLLTGSFNFTYAAEHKNAENSLLLDCPDLAAQYQTNWELHKSHSKKLN